MLSYQERGGYGPLLFMIHWLGGSSRSWTEVSEQIAPHGFRCVSVDLPGFGESSDLQDFSIEAMVRDLVETIRSLRSSETGAPWLLAGHSMGGKLAAIIARAAEQGEGLEHLRGLVLLSPSPPSPEPMAESKRKKNIHALGPKTHDAAERQSHAAQFVDNNTGKLSLLDAVRERSIDDILRMNPDAFAAWMTTGSKEDWSQHVGKLHVPALILAGTEDKALGPAAQQERTLGHFTMGKLVALDGGGHLAPLERPWEVADRMMEFFNSLGLAKRHVPLSPGFAALIASDQTAPQTRKVMQDRMDGAPAYKPVLEIEELRTLRALAACVIPGAGFDLAARLDQALAQRAQDGWRFASLPDDVVAWKQGLASLDASSHREFSVPFIALDLPRQHALLERARKGTLGKGILGTLHLGEGAAAFDAIQMQTWFEDLRGELVKLYVADPRTMERIGFTGFADEKGFTQIRLGEQDEVAR